MENLHLYEARDALQCDFKLGNGKESRIEHLSESEILEIREKLKSESRSENIKANFYDKDPKIEPSIPSWLTDRPHLSLNFFIPEKTPDVIGPLGEVAATTQEQQLLEDILFLMVGCQAMYITTSVDKNSSLPTFSVDSSVEPSLRALVNRILPLCRHYSQIVSFVEEQNHYYHGTVNHALCSAMRNLLKDYILLVTQLESQQIQGTLTLQRLWFYVEKTLTLMEMLAELAASIKKAKCHGGEVLSLLHDRILSLTGCGQLQDVVIYLTEAASVPYVKMLSLWIYRGVIVDRYKEFMVKDNEELKDDEIESSLFLTDPNLSDDYWENRYAMCVGNIPAFLRSHADMILRTGKYLNVILESDPTVVCPAQEEIWYSFRDKKYTDIIEKNYSFASKRLLQLLMQEKDLMCRLRSIKHYFLLDQGDFFVQLLALCEGELSKNIDYVVPTRLKSLLELCLRTCAGNSETFTDDIQCTLFPYSLMSQMLQILSIETEEECEYKNAPEKLHLTGLQGFTLTYNIEWPLSLVIDRKSVFCYQLIFRHLFYCKYVEGLLCRVWVSHKGAKNLAQSSTTTYTQAFALGQRMINFIQNLEYYMNFEVIERHWQIFISKMQKVDNIDEVLVCHSEFIKGCLKDCMLTSPELLRIVCKLTNICVNFANFILCMRKHCDDAELDVWSIVADSNESDYEMTCNEPNCQEVLWTEDPHPLCLLHRRCITIPSLQLLRMSCRFCLEIIEAGQAKQDVGDFISSVILAWRQQNGEKSKDVLTPGISLEGKTLKDRLVPSFPNIQYPGPSTPHEESQTFEQTITRLDFEFTETLVSLMDKIVDMGRENYNDALIHLLYRLDFNNFYNQKRENLPECYSPTNADGLDQASG